MLKADLIERFYTTEKDLKLSKVFKDETFYKLFVSAGERYNSFYHYLSEIAVYDKYDEILYTLDPFFIRGLKTTTSLISEIISTKIYKKRYVVEPLLFVSKVGYINSADFVFKYVSNRNRHFNNLIDLDIPLLPHFSTNIQPSVIRQNFSELYHYFPKMEKLNLVDVSNNKKNRLYECQGLHILYTKKTTRIYYHDYLIDTTRTLKEAKFLVNEINTKINFNNMLDRQTKISGVKISEEEHEIIKQEIIKLRRREDNYCFY